MTYQFSRRIPSLIALFLGLIFPGLQRPTLAQTYKEVELEVAGPWAYVTDPADASRIVVISPNINHLMAVFPGGDANHFSGPLDPGVYKLDFKTGPCAPHHPVAQRKLYDIFTDGMPNAVSDAIGAKNQRVAISVPKPCYYESYLQSYAKVSAGKIDERTPEAEYTIWMSLHYTVPPSTTSATLDGTLDSPPSPFPQVTVQFQNSPKPPTNSAISVVAYYGNSGEDYSCDLHSAEHFDAAMSLWGQNGFYRLFPELDSTAKQTHRYAYDLKKCAQNFSDGMHAKMVRADSLLKIIEAIRTDLSASKLDAAILKLQGLRETILPLWTPQAPDELRQDLSHSLEILVGMRSEGKAFPQALTGQFLIVTSYYAAPGRADCHAMQVNVDGTVL